MDYPNIIKGIRWCLVVGGVIGLAGIALFYWLSKQPQTTDVSWASVSWWELCKIGAFLFAITGIPAGLLAAFRPRFRARNTLDSP